MKAKFPVLILLGLAITFVIGCEDLLNLGFESGEQTVVFTIEPVEAGVHTLAEDTVITDIDEILAKNDIASDDLIKKVVVNEATVTVTAGESNFDKLENIEVWIKVDDEDEVKLAWYDSIPNGLTTLDLELTEVNLMDYITKEYYFVKLKATVSDDVTEEVTMKATMIYTLSL